MTVTVFDPDFNCFEFDWISFRYKQYSFLAGSFLAGSVGQLLSSFFRTPHISQKLLQKSDLLWIRPCPVYSSASSKPTTEFAQPRLSRVQARSSPARGYNWSCVCSYMAGHYPGILMTGHIGTNTRPNLDPLAGDDRTLTLLKRGCANSVVGLELAELPFAIATKTLPTRKKSFRIIFRLPFHDFAFFELV